MSRRDGSSRLRLGDGRGHRPCPRLARSLKNLLEIVEATKAKGAGIRSLPGDIDTTTPAGRLVFHVLASVAQFELERLAERRRGGGLPALSPAQKAEVRRMRDEDGRPVAAIAQLLRASRTTVRRA